MNASLSAVNAPRFVADDVYDPMAGCEYHRVRSRRTDQLGLEVASWTHHGTSWIAAVGILTAATTAVLAKALELVRSSTTVHVVLNVTGLTRLDDAGTHLIEVEYDRLAEQGVTFTTILPLEAAAPVRSPGRRVARALPVAEPNC